MISVCGAVFALLTCSYVFAEFPARCGRNVIINSRLKRDDNIPLPHILEFPFMASVQTFFLHKDIKPENIFDGRMEGGFVGSILAPSVVLVPCRCVANMLGLVGGREGTTANPKHFGVLAGTPWDFSPVEDQVGQMRFAINAILHPKCELFPSFYLWDLAVLILKEPFLMIPNVVEEIAIFPTEELTAAIGFAQEKQTGCFTAGWGWAWNSHKTDRLKWEVVPVILRELAACNRSYPHPPAHDASYVHTCVESISSDLRRKKTGDAGSPILCLPDFNMDKVMFVGIKSEEHDDTPDGFSIYTRLDIDVPWLQQLIQDPPRPASDASATHLTPLTLTAIIWARIENMKSAV